MQILSSTPRISTGVHSYLLGEEILLFNERDGTIFRLNSSAAFIWCCIEEGLDRPSITDELANTFDLTASQAAEDLVDVLDEWESLGLLNIPGDALADKQEIQEEIQNHEGILKPSARLSPCSSGHQYQLLDSVIKIRFTDAGLEEITRSVLGHLKVADNITHDIEFSIQKDTKGYFLYRDQELIDHCNNEQELGPLLHGHVVQSVYKTIESLLTLHAGAVSNENHCIVLPAVSGSGKSTLTAALINSGLKYWTDEIVFLQRKTHAIKAIPAGIGLKTGSWPVLQPFYPAIDRLPVYLRQDDQHVRYLLPDNSQLPDNPTQPCPVHALVFPVYRAGADAGFNAITPADALCRVTDAGYDVEGGLDTERVAELVDWIGKIPCYELQYHDLNEAISRVKGLMPS